MELLFILTIRIVHTSLLWVMVSREVSEGWLAMLLFYHLLNFPILQKYFQFKVWDLNSLELIFTFQISWNLFCTIEFCWSLWFWFSNVGFGFLLWVISLKWDYCSCLLVTLSVSITDVKIMFWSKPDLLIL